MNRNFTSTRNDLMKTTSSSPCLQMVLRCRAQRGRSRSSTGRRPCPAAGALAAVALAMCALGPAARPLRAQATPNVPERMTYQGFLTDGNGVALGNTVYIGGASGGVWKTTNFLTRNSSGPIWVPLTDFGPTTSLNIADIEVFSRNGDNLEVEVPITVAEALRRARDGDLVCLAVDITEQMRIWAAIEAIPDGFVLFDREDRLVFCNQRYRDIHPPSADIITPGVTFEEILRHGLKLGKYPEAEGREEDWLQNRMQRHLSPSSISEQQMPDGRWLPYGGEWHSGIVRVRIVCTPGQAHADVAGPGAG